MIRATVRVTVRMSFRMTVRVTLTMVGPEGRLEGICGRGLREGGGCGRWAAAGGRMMGVGGWYDQLQPWASKLTRSNVVYSWLGQEAKFLLPIGSMSPI